MLCYSCKENTVRQEDYDKDPYQGRGSTIINLGEHVYSNDKVPVP